MEQGNSSLSTLLIIPGPGPVSWQFLSSVSAKFRPLVKSTVCTVSLAADTSGSRRKPKQSVRSCSIPFRAIIHFISCTWKFLDVVPAKRRYAIMAGIPLAQVLLPSPRVVGRLHGDKKLEMTGFAGCHAGRSSHVLENQESAFSQGSGSVAQFVGLFQN